MEEVLCYNCLKQKKLRGKKARKGRIMTKKERVLHAFHNEPVDRVPIAFWYHFSPDDDFGQETIDEHLRLYREADFDLIKVMCDGYFNYPNPGIAQIKNPEDWFNLKPLGADHPYIRKQIARVKGVVEAVKDDCCVFYNVFCPMSLMRFGTSEELLMSHLKANPEAVCHAFEVIGEDIRSLIKGVIEEAGCTGIYYCVQNAEEFRFTAEEYKKIVTPAELAVLEYANTLSDNNILHCCGWAGDKNRIEVWKDYPARAVNWAVYVEDLSLKDGKNYFGGRCVLGGFDNRKTGVLYSGSKQAIKDETKRLLKETETVGVILGGDCTVPSDIDHERFIWVREAADEFMGLLTDKSIRAGR